MQVFKKSKIGFIRLLHRELVGSICIITVIGCTTVPKPVTIESSEPEAAIYIDDVKHGKGSVTFTPASTIDTLNVKLVADEYFDYNEILYSDKKTMWEIEPERAKKNSNIGIFMLSAGTALVLADILLLDEDADEKGLLAGGGILWISIGVGGLFGPSFKNNSWEKKYRIDMSSASKWDKYGYHKETGFNRAGYNKDGYDSKGNYYSGNFKYNKKNGKGIYIDLDGNRFDGNFLLDMKSGFGKEYYTDGTFFIGYWKDNLKNGLGYLSKENDIVVQNWELGKLIDSYSQSGKIKSDKFKWIYLGKDAINGLANGIGDAITQDGKNKIQNGTFIKGVLVQGTVINAYNDKFSGNFKGDSLIDGSIEYNSGSIYIGSLENNIPNGYGELKSKEGFFYQGNFKEGLFDGVGTIIYPNKSKYEGNFSDGEFNGEGSLTRPTGESYEGTFVDGQPHGMGIYFNGDQVERCEYYKGNRIDQAFVIRQENLRAEQVRREERIAAAKAEEERKKLERERKLALEKEKQKKNTSNFFNGLLLGGVAGGTAGMFGVDVVDAVSIGTSVFIDTVNETPGTTTLNTLTEVNQNLKEKNNSIGGSTDSKTANSKIVEKDTSIKYPKDVSNDIPKKFNGTYSDPNDPDDTHIIYLSRNGSGYVEQWYPMILGDNGYKAHKHTGKFSSIKLVQNSHEHYSLSMNVMSTCSTCNEGNYTVIAQLIDENPPTILWGPGILKKNK